MSLDKRAIRKWRHELKRARRRKGLRLNNLERERRLRNRRKNVRMFLGS